METQCFCSPSLAARGQGCLIVWLTVTWLWSLGAGQPSLDSSYSVSLSDTAWMTLSTSPPPLPATAFLPEVTTSTLTFTPVPTAPASDPESSSGAVILPTSVTSFVRDAPPSTDSLHGDVSSPHTLSLVSEREVLQSSFVPAGGWLYSTPAASIGPSSDLSSSFGTKTLEGWERVTASVLDDSASLPSVRSTVFVDSVATSVRRDPTQGLGEAGVFVSHGQQSTQEHLATFVSVPHEASGSAAVLIAPTSPLVPLTLSPSKDSAFHTSRGDIETSSSASLPEVSSVTGMLDMNFTQNSTVFQPTAGETTSLLSSTLDVTSPGPSGSNGSCTEKDAGCVEYRGNEDEEEQELRIKIIVGAACGAVLLVVILGVFIGCVMRRRGKMPSGSKIDLSSYWDDSVTLSYINGHVDMPKDSADEMISLDNDSFLNSLDSMSFTNTWTSDTSKHTNF
ncbi:uncharacterized protein LOC143290803 [Babylonia areolata]|uniref:uncharacterized protein LOC143290803 n=1 Tax=Babylonia areolata TaxID=304850 RepID=UPI003FD0B515